MMRLPLVTGALAVALLGCACSGSGGTTPEETVIDTSHSPTAPERRFIHDLYHSQDGTFWIKRAQSLDGHGEGGQAELVFDGTASCSPDAKLTGIPADVAERFVDIAKRDLCNAPP